MTSWLENKVDSADNPGTPTTPTRSVDGAAFVPSASKYVMCMYTLELDCDNDEVCTVELRSDAANPPLTVRASAYLAPSDPGAATPKVVARQQLTYVAQPGHFVKLVKTGGSTGTASVAHQTELAIS